jgi:hypothetical protein
MSNFNKKNGDFMNERATKAMSNIERKQALKLLNDNVSVLRARLTYMKKTRNKLFINKIKRSAMAEKIRVSCEALSIKLSEEGLSFEELEVFDEMILQQFALKKSKHRKPEIPF